MCSSLEGLVGSTDIATVHYPINVKTDVTSGALLPRGLRLHMTWVFSPHSAIVSTLLLESCDPCF